ncbi:18683_t:CDS:2, partial [Gigaspora margarita]
LSAESLVRISLNDNSIHATNISVFSRFINLKVLDLDQLKDLDISSTDISKGLEYLLLNFVLCVSVGTSGYNICCEYYVDIGVGYKQLSNSGKMLIACPELFEGLDDKSDDKVLGVLNKIFGNIVC